MLLITLLSTLTSAFYIVSAKRQRERRKLQQQQSFVGICGSASPPGPQWLAFWGMGTLVETLTTRQVCFSKSSALICRPISFPEVHPFRAQALHGTLAICHKFLFPWMWKPVSRWPWWTKPHLHLTAGKQRWAVSHSPCLSFDYLISSAVLFKNY